MRPENQKLGRQQVLPLARELCKVCSTQEATKFYRVPGCRIQPQGSAETVCVPISLFLFPSFPKCGPIVLANGGLETEKTKKLNKQANKPNFQEDLALKRFQSRVWVQFLTELDTRWASAGEVAPKAGSVPAGCSQWKMLEAATVSGERKVPNPWPWHKTPGTAARTEWDSRGRKVQREAEGWW